MSTDVRHVSMAALHLVLLLILILSLLGLGAGIARMLT
jgi:hypothetical protein